MKLQRICVFCGSSAGTKAAYRDAAIALADTLLERKLGLVYGGASVGLMGLIADRVLAGGGEVIGVIPNNLVELEVAHRGLADLRYVASMQERKALMAELSDAFISLPGGFGTLDEMTEMVTWSILGLHQKPSGLLNVGGYYDELIRFFDRAVADGFIKPQHRARLIVASHGAELLDTFSRPPTSP